MKSTLLMKFFRFWPPFWGAGIKVKEFKQDLSYILVQLKMHFWNKNYMGTHFGGSLYAMTDPFYVLMLIKQLGPGYIVWDKAATIRYKKPGKGIVFAQFSLSQQQVNDIKEEVEQCAKAEPLFLIQITNSQHEVVAEVEKRLHIQKNYPQITILIEGRLR